MDTRAAFIDLNVPGWLAARRYGVPAEMVAAASQRRLAGDWRSACAAARVDPRFDAKTLRSRFGAEVAGQVEEDLAHLAPDLARWHAPRRLRGGSGLLRPDHAVLLAWYHDEVLLSLRTAPRGGNHQRMELDCTLVIRGSLRENWVDARYLWDARHAPALLQRLGGGDRTPFFHRDGTPWTQVGVGDDPVALTERVTLLQDDGQIGVAWAAAGVRADDLWEVYRRPKRPWAVSELFGAMVPALAAEARRLLAASDRASTVVPSPLGGGGPAASLALTLEADGLRATTRRHSDSVIWLARPAWQRFPDLELLRTGRIRPDEVHPLVRSAMFPDQPDPGYRPRLPEPSTMVGTTRVRCAGQWHRLPVRDGALVPTDHPGDEVAREHVVGALGGRARPCVAVVDAWRGPVPGRLPRRLRELRRHANALLIHGDEHGFRALLDTGIDPTGLRDREGRGPLHRLATVDDPLPLLHQLLALGMDIDARDSTGRTALAAVLFAGGSADLVRAMLDAGANPVAIDKGGSTMLHLLRSVDAARIVPWLVAAGVDPKAKDHRGRRPLAAQTEAGAPPEVVRAIRRSGR